MRSKRFFTAVCLLLVVALSALAGCAGKETQLAPGETAGAESALSVSGDEKEESAPETSSAMEEDDAPAPTEEALSYPESNVETDAEDETQTAEEPQTEASAEWVSPRVGVSAPVEDSWFADAAFVGNSLTEGFYAWSGVQCGDAYASTSMSVLGVADADVITLEDGSVGTILEGLAQKQYGKVYILLGINEIAMRPADFRAAYANMLDRIESIQPDADIYVQGLSPVTKWKSDSDSFFNMQNVRAFNCELYELAAERGLYYIDLCEALAGEDGYLPDEEDTDGVHFVMSYYAEWYDYLKTHTK